MFNLISNPFVIVLLFLIPVMAYLVYLCVVYKTRIHNLLAEAEIREAEVRFKETVLNSLKEHIRNKEKKTMLYTYDSGTHYIENVISWKGDNQHLRLDLNDGSMCVVTTPSQYKFIAQGQSKEEPRT